MWIIFYQQTDYPTFCHNIDAWFDENDYVRIILDQHSIQTYYSDFVPIIDVFQK
jgi:hypothetical protein